MVAPAVSTRIVAEERDDAIRNFDCDVEETDYELALFMAPAPIEDAMA